MITTSKRDVVVRVRGNRAAATRRGVTAVWQARSWWGGFIAVALGVMGENVLMAGGDADIALRYYLAGVVLLILALFHPGRPGGLPRRTHASPSELEIAPEAAPSAAPLPVRRARTAALATAWPTPTGRRSVTPATVPAFVARGTGRMWGRWCGLRARLGWRFTLPALLLTAALTAATAFVLVRNITDSLGGWLWVGAMAALILTFAGAHSPRNMPGALGGPESDFFSRGVPTLPVRWEVALAVLMLAAALILRVVNLEHMPGIFGDEGERGMDARAIVEGRAAPLFGLGWWSVPNLYFYGIAWMIRIFGDNMVGERMLSVVSGVLAIWFVYRTGRLLFGVRAGLIAGTLLAVSPLWLQFSREGGESTPTGMLWAGGFYFLVRALRFRRWSDWTLSGLLYGFSLYYYAAGKLVVPLLGFVGLYCLIRWRLYFFKRYLLGFVLLGVAFGLAFLPYAVFLQGDQWHGFFGRAQETSIFSPQHQANTFAKYGIPYDPAQGGQTLTQNILTHPWPWAQVLFQQTRAATEVLYRSGDSAFFYTLREHYGTLFSPFLAVLAVLGLVYAGWKFWDGRYGLLLVWFWTGMLGVTLTIDVPNVQRLVGAWPVALLFPALIIDRIWAGAWPLSPALARRWATVPILVLLLFFGADGYREYFVSYAGQCTFCSATVQARYAEQLGQDYKAYQLGVGSYDIYFTYGSTRFVAKGVEGTDLNVPMDYFPITDNNGKGAAFIVYPSNADYLPLIKLFYPGGEEKPAKGTDGSFVFTSYKVNPELMATFQSLRAQYVPQVGSTFTRNEPNLGTVRPDGSPAGFWSPPPNLAYPAQATWQGALVAPEYGLYTFALKGVGDARLELDGRIVLDERTPGEPAQRRQITLVLAKGMHDVNLSGTLASAGASVELLWAGGTNSPIPIASNYLYNGPTGGLSGSIVSNVLAPLTDPDPFAGQVPNVRRSDPFLGVRDTGASTSSFGQIPFIARWEGTLYAPADGPYRFEFLSSGQSALLIDGKVVVDQNAGGGQATLAQGPHSVDVRYAWPGGRGYLEWFWTPPGGPRTLVPTTVLRPAARSWARGDVPDPLITPRVSVPSPAVKVLPGIVLGTDAGLIQARGIGVDAEGRVFIGDNGNHRLVVLNREGKVTTQWGSPISNGSAPGKINLLGDIAVAPNGHILTIDSANGDLQEYTADGKVVHTVPGLAAGSGGIAVEGGVKTGRIYIAHTATSSILRLTPEGVVEKELFGGEQGTPGRLEQPIDVAVAPDGAVYVVDMHSRIVQLDGDGDVVHEWPVEVGFKLGGSHLTFWQGHVVMSDPDRNRLVILDPATGAVRLIGHAGVEAGEFNTPVGLAVGPDDKLYVMDSQNGRVQVFGSELLAK